MRSFGNWFLGALSLWPVLYLGLFTYEMVACIPGQPDCPLFEQWGDMMHIFTILLTFALLITFSLLTYQSSRLTNEQKNFWYGVFWMAGPLSMPWFWFRHLRNPSGANDGRRSLP